MTNLIKRLAFIALALACSLSAFVACNDENEKETGAETGTETESGSEEKLTDFDYENANITEYITVSKNDYLSTTVTLGTEYIITQEAVDVYIESERFDNKSKTNGDTQVTDQPIKLGDTAYIYYTGYIDGKAFEGGSNATSEKPHELSIGSGSFIPGFEECLIGIIPANTSKENPHAFNISFPTDYHSADLAGKAAVFEVWIEYIVQYTVPELTDDYVKNTVKYDGTVAQYKEYVKKTLQTESDGKAELAALDAITSKLMEKATILKYPEESLAFWYEQYIDQYEYYMQMYTMYGMTFKSLDEFVMTYFGLKEGDDWKAITMEYVKDTVKNILIYYAVAEQQNITVSNEELIAEAKELAEYYSSQGTTKYTYTEIIEQIGESALRQNILMEKIDKLFIENCTIEYKDK